MSIDTSKMTPAEASQAQMFETLLDTMPTEALVMLRSLLDEKIAERG